MKIILTDCRCVCVDLSLSLSIYIYIYIYIYFDLNFVNLACLATLKSSENETGLSMDDNI